MTNYKTSHQVNYGIRILPVKRVEIFSPEEWEEFIEEWVDLKKEIYLDIDRFGGAGDKGRDVVAYVTDKNIKDYIWDCFQCKHYDSSLMPTQVYVEFGKILYHTFNQEYPIPRNYYFIAPKGCGTTLSKYLQDKDELRQKVIANWDAYCKTKITNLDVPLVGAFLEYVKRFDFSIFSRINTKEIIKEHSEHPNHIIRFGGGLPERLKLIEDDIPIEIQMSENKYVQQLMLAYSSDSTESFSSPNELSMQSNYSKHFTRARISFHHAEQLRNFSRDSLPPETFTDFQNEIYEGIINIVESEHENGFMKVKETENEAKRIQITSNPLKEVSIINDRCGICHQLVNDEKIKWVDNE